MLKVTEINSGNTVSEFRRMLQAAFSVSDSVMCWFMMTNCSAVQPVLVQQQVKQMLPFRDDSQAELAKISTLTVN
jgi:hypothetical protein